MSDPTPEQTSTHWRDDIPNSGYTHVKVVADLEWGTQECKDYFDRKFDSSKPHMIVHHRNGKTEKLHFHVHGVLKPGISKGKVHKDAHHPAKKLKKKPFQMKAEHFHGATADGFMYMLKPAEAQACEAGSRELSDLVIKTSFSDDFIDQIITDSRTYFLKMKSTLTSALTVAMQNVTSSITETSAMVVYSRLITAALDHISSAGGVINPGQVRARVLTTMYQSDVEAYKAYVRAKCQ